MKRHGWCTLQKTHKLNVELLSTCFHSAGMPFNGHHSPAHSWTPWRACSPFQPHTAADSSPHICSNNTSLRMRAHSACHHSTKRTQMWSISRLCVLSAPHHDKKSNGHPTMGPEWRTADLFFPFFPFHSDTSTVRPPCPDRFLSYSLEQCTQSHTTPIHVCLKYARASNHSHVELNLPPVAHVSVLVTSNAVPRLFEPLKLCRSHSKPHPSLVTRMRISILY